MNKDYTPIDCSLYDHYEAWATLRTELLISHRDGTGALRTISGVISDLMNREGAEWMMLGSGLEIRLDRLVEVRPAKAM